MTKTVITPKGAGIYIRALDPNVHGLPAQAAKKAKDHGVSFVAIMACWQDIQDGKFRQVDANRRNDTMKRYSEAFKKEGIDPWIWGYPWAGHEDAYIESMFNAWVPGVTVGMGHDPELGSKWSTKAAPKGRTMRGQPEAITGVAASGSQQVRRGQADKVMHLTLQQLPEGGGYFTTSYGIARYHKNFPWKEYMQFGAISPQLYEEDLPAIDGAIDEWLVYKQQATGLPVDQIQIVPSVAAYGKMAQLYMRRYLASFLLTKHPIHGVIVWSWRQIDEHEWDEIHRFSDDLAAGATVLSANHR